MNPCAIYDENKFFRSFKNTYPKELELKVEHKETHVTFPNLDITITDKFFIYELFKKRDKFPFFIVTMPHLSSNSSVFHGSLYWKLLSTDKCTLLFSDFTPEASELYNRIVLQGDNTEQLQNHPKRMFQKYSTVLLKYNITFTKLWNSILTNWSTFLLLLLLLLYYYYHLHQITYSLMMEAASFSYYINAIFFEYTIHYVNIVIYNIINLISLFFLNWFIFKVW